MATIGLTDRTTEGMVRPESFGAFDVADLLALAQPVGRSIRDRLEERTLALVGVLFGEITGMDLVFA